MLHIPQDLRYALRSLGKSAGLTLIAAVTLGLGIGANTAMVGLFDALLVRPPEGVRDPQRLVRVESEVPGPPGRPPHLDDVLSYTQFSALQSRARGFTGVTAYATTPLSVGEGEGARNESVILASGDYFQVLGVRAAAGRLLQPDDDREGAANPVAVLSWEFWQRAYGGDPGILGQRIEVAGQPLTVVGVAPRHFVGAELASPALWVPLSLAAQLGYMEEFLLSPFVSWLRVVGRLAPGATLEQAQSTAQAALLAAEEQRLTAAPPSMGRGGAPGGARIEISVGPGGRPAGAVPGPAPPRVRLVAVAGAGRQMAPPGPRGSGQPPVQLWYLAVTAAVLLIACANVANLLLASGAARRHEMAVRLSLGATPRRLGRLLLTESAVLAGLGGMVGLGVALGVWRLLPALVSLPPLPPLWDPRTLAVTAVLAALTVLLFGVAPLVALRRSDIRSVLAADAPSLAPRSRGRGALVAAQFALSVLLLIGAGLFIRSFHNLRDLDLGFRREEILLVTADTRGAGWTPERAEAFWSEAQERVSRMPGVRSVALGSSVPYLMRMMMPFTPAGAESAGPEQVEPTQLDRVSPAFFETLGIPILEGRSFSVDDRRGAAPVAIVSRSFAREQFAGESPVGRCLSNPMGGGCVEVVGVAGDARFGELTDASPAFVYLPIEQRSPMAPGASVLHVRTDRDPAAAALTGALRNELRQIPGAPPQVEVRSLDELIAPQLAPWRASALLLGIFGGLGLLLAAVGLYGVVAFLVSQRTREIGIRVALGAGRRQVFALVLADAARLVGTGAAAGLALALILTRFAGSILYGVGSMDPLVYLVTAVLLAGVALLAAFAPALRAVRVSPMEALRTE